MSENFLDKNEFRTSQAVTDLTREDIPAVINLQAQKVINPEEVAQNESSKLAAEANGFLVYPITSEELESSLGNTAYIAKVAKLEGLPVGHIISYDLDEWQRLNPGWGTDLKKMLGDTKVLYGRHIAVDKEAQSHGIGKSLLTSTLEEARRRGYQKFIAEVMASPLRNKRSSNFLKGIGGQELDTFQDGSREWTVYSIDLEKS